MKDRLRHLLVESRGGANRARILAVLDDHPANANQLAEHLGLNYNTVRYHLAVLREHGLVEASGDDYGALHFVTDQFDHHREAIECLVEELR